MSPHRATRRVQVTVTADDGKIIDAFFVELPRGFAPEMFDKFIREALEDYFVVVDAGHAELHAK
jgi:hypothetical protein